jgi:hypothetical protein
VTWLTKKLTECSRYLINLSSRYSICALAASANIAHSCITYLNTTVMFLGEDHREICKAEIAKGQCGVHRYAMKNWVAHLSSSIRPKTHVTELISTELHERLQELCWVQKGNLPKPAASKDAEQSSLEPYKRSPEVFQLMQSILNYESSIQRIEQEAENPEGRHIMLLLHISQFSMTTSPYSIFVTVSAR